MPTEPAAGAAALPADAATPPTRAVLASMFGTVVEWYDFSVYGAASALVFGRIFFPNVDAMAGLLASYGAFAVGFLIRPIGGVFFSYFGDASRSHQCVLAPLVNHRKVKHSTFFDINFGYAQMRRVCNR